MTEEEANKKLMDKIGPELEGKLSALAESHLDSEVAKLSMKLLRKLYDQTYFWCEDCDGLVTTKDNCCLNSNNTDAT